MILIIPLGGIGERFKNNGYTTPKALINIFGKPMLYYLIDNLNLNDIDLIIIPYNIEYLIYNLESRLKKDFPNIVFKFCCLENNTRGAAETINIGLNSLDKIDNKPVLCIDADNFYLYDIVTKWNGHNCVFTFKDEQTNPIYSYVITDDDDFISDIKEKNKISNNACCGAYGFESIILLKKYISKIISNNIMQKSEFYTSGVIKQMLIDNIKFKNHTISINKFVSLGTPLHLRLFYNNYPQISCINNKVLIESKRICFDLDNTLVTFPKIKDDYSSVEPIQKNISLLRYLKKFNNTIIIYTARRMKTHNGNIGKLTADIGKITLDTLEKFNIPYDEIYFGKPYADFYIDDLAINTTDNIEKNLGFYNNIISSRNFNDVKILNIDIITKKGSDLTGEIYYYNNIPVEIKDLFPIMLNHNTNMYQVEKINGITVTEMYLSEMLTENNLIHILNSIKRIQNVKIKDQQNINIYGNYIDKIKKRFLKYDYSKFKNYKSIYNSITSKLDIYEKNKCGKKTVIHGDSVFTNILINNYGKIKFIDMRGKILNKLTIFGDWLYDWSKIYQSLIGYDLILMSKTISKEYQNNLISCFKEYFILNFSINDFNNLKTITKSLLFSLIPIHDNNKCYEYYNLINCIYLD